MLCVFGVVCVVVFVCYCLCIVWFCVCLVVLCGCFWLLSVVFDSFLSVSVLSSLLLLGVFGCFNLV